MKQGENNLRAVCVEEAVLVHDPVGPLALRRPPGVEDERLLHPDDPGTMAHLPVLAGGLPVPSRRGAVGAGAVGVLAVEAAEEVPLGVAGAEAGAGGQVPGLELVEVDLGDGVDLERAAEDLALEVVGYELLVGGVEAEARREGGGLGRPRRRRGRQGGGRRRGRVGHVHATRADWLAAAARARVGRGDRGLGGLEWIGESFEGDERRKKGVWLGL